MKKFFLYSFILITLLQAAYARPRLVKTTIQSNPSGATVIIHGGNYVNESHSTPTTQNLHQGQEYTLTFILSGYETKSVSYTAGNGSVSVTLSRAGSDDGPTITEVEEEDPVNRVRASITSDPSKARVTVKGGDYQSETYQTPCKLYFDEGSKYTLTFSKSGYVTERVTFYGGERNLHVSLEPEISYYNTTIDSNVRDAKVYIDGDYIGETRCSTELEEGNHSLKVVKSGYNTYTASIRVTSDDTLYIELEEQKYMRLSLPAGAKLWVDGSYIKLNYKDKSNQTFKIKASGRTEAKIKIQYYGLVIEQYIPFNKQTVKLNMLLE